MPGPSAVIGGVASAFVPDVEDRIALGYTDVRWYFATSETATATLASSSTLVAGTRDYSYNKTDAAPTDWVEWCLYGAVPGESGRSPRVPLGPPSISRKDVRQGVGSRLEIMELVTATGTAATTFTAPELIDPDRSVHTIGNAFARAVSGSYQVTRRVRAGATGYSNRTTGEVTVNRTFGGTLGAATEVELWSPRGETDPSARIDAAMQRARAQLWWEDTYYLALDADVTEYFLPQGIQKEGVKAVEWASETYPEAPGWLPVGSWDIVSEGQQPLISILSAGEGSSRYSEGTVVRIVYNRFGDRMDDDADTWSVPLEWAIAETAFEYLRGQVVPNGARENVSDDVTAAKALFDECLGYRAVYMPSPPRPAERLPR